MESFKCLRALSPLLQTPRPTDAGMKRFRMVTHACPLSVGPPGVPLAGVTSDWCGVVEVVVVKHLNIDPSYHTGVRIISFAVIKG